jgi:multidrug efflux pump subunit AcrB
VKCYQIWYEHEVSGSNGYYGVTDADEDEQIFQNKEDAEYVATWKNAQEENLVFDQWKRKKLLKDRAQNKLRVDRDKAEAAGIDPKLIAVPYYENVSDEFKMYWHDHYEYYVKEFELV